MRLWEWKSSGSSNNCCQFQILINEIVVNSNHYIHSANIYVDAQTMRRWRLLLWPRSNVSAQWRANFVSLSWSQSNTALVNQTPPMTHEWVQECGSQDYWSVVVSPQHTVADLSRHDNFRFVRNLCMFAIHWWIVSPFALIVIDFIM